MQEITKFISCVVLPNEFEEAKASGYTEIYVMTSGGPIKHHKLRGENRYVRTKVAKIPKFEDASFKEEIKFLPDGKIPISLFDQIVAFFKKVMTVKNAELEAQAHVLWNKEQGYHIGIPPQRISKASVSYDWSYIPDGTSIICDIH